MYIGFKVVYWVQKLKLIMESMQVLFQFGFSEFVSCFAFWRFIMLLVLCVWRFRFGPVLIIYSSAKFRRRIPIDHAYRFICSVIPWVHCRDWCWGWWRLCMTLVFHEALLAIDRLAGLVMYLTVIFSFCYFFWGLDLLEGLKLSYVLGHWFGHSLWPLMQTNSAWSLTQNTLLQLFVGKPNCVMIS